MAISPFKSILSSILLLSCISTQSLASTEVNVYSARKEALIKPLLKRFTKETGINVNLVTGKADALLKRLESEGRNTPADLLITTDAGRLNRALQANVLQAVQSKTLNAVIPANYREPGGYWYGLSVRARPIFYVKDKVNEADLSSYEALTEQKFKGRICIRSSNNIYNQSLVASMIAANGVAATEKWATGLVKNMARPPRGGDRDQIRAAASGQCDIAIANTYYFGAMLAGKKKKDKIAASKMALFWPNQSTRGVHVNISGAGITRHATNRDNAVLLLEFLANKDSQKWYAETNHEYPVRDDVEASDLLKSWGVFKSDAINLSILGKNNPKAVKLMDRAGWK